MKKPNSVLVHNELMLVDNGECIGMLQASQVLLLHVLGPGRTMSNVNTRDT